MKFFDSITINIIITIVNNNKKIKFASHKLKQQWLRKVIEYK